MNFSSVAQQIASRHFDNKTIETLAKKGVQFIGTVAIPLYEGDVYNCDTAYSIVIGGEMGAIRTHAQLRIMASSGWTANEFLEATED